MGINGLLKVIKPICQERHVQDLAHTRVGVDVYGWLHKGAFSCALNLCRGIDTARFVQFCMHRVRMLIHFNVTPILVFDGAELPMKADTHTERRERREEAMRKAEQAFASGDRRKAEEWYQRAYTVTSEMARQVIRECRKINVEYVIAPYEADAQLAWMVKTGYIDGVITEDSDMLVYGASKILFKMNRFGNGDLYESRNLPSLDSLNMNNFTQDMFMYMSVCAGCDFFKGVQGLGIKKGHAIVKRFRTMKRLILAIRQDRRYNVQKSFPTDFARACLVFRHQTVFDMRTTQHVHLNAFDDEARANLPQGVLSASEDGILDLSFLGTHHDTTIAKKIAQGYVHPRSLEEYIDPLDTVSRPVTKTIRPRSFPRPPGRRRVESTESKKVRGFQVQPASITNGASGSNQASGSNRARFSSSLNLRQRLSGRMGGAQSFNPRRVGAAFKARHGTTTTASPGVWASFKTSREQLHSDRDPIRLDTSDVNDDMQSIADDSLHADTKEDESMEQKENFPPPADSSSDIPPRDQSPELADGDPQETAEQVVPDPAKFTCGEEPKTQENFRSNDDSKTEEVLRVPDSVQSPKRRRVTSSHRVEAVKRAIGRFAQTEKKDIAKKFMTTEKERSSPEEENYDLLADMDAIVARPEETRKLSPKKNVKSELRKKLQGTPKPKSVTQVRLSRFFPPRKQDEKDGTSKETKRRLAALRDTKLYPSKPKGGIQKIRKQMGSSSLNKFKRGAVGRTAVVRGKNM